MWSIGYSIREVTFLYSTPRGQSLIARVLLQTNIKNNIHHITACIENTKILRQRVVVI